MTSRRSIGSVLVLLACCMATMASTASAAIPAPPGGPILVVTPAGGSSNYLPEILRSEGLNDFDRADIGSVSAATLAAHDVVVLADMSLSTDQVGMFTNWVIAGGNLIAMHPRGNLAPLLGLSGPSSSTPAAGGYLRVNTSTGPGAGITNEVIQYHGSADNYALNGANAIANLWSSASSPTGNPAVVAARRRGQRRPGCGLHLRPRAVGHPDAPGQPGVGRPGPRRQRADPLQRSLLRWRPARLARPQQGRHPAGGRAAAAAGEPHHRDGAHPMPRFWYLPNGLKTALVLTGDDHGRDGGSGTATRFAHDVAAKPSCSAAELANWDCVRSTSYTYPDSGLTAADVAHYRALGFEIALHLHVTGSSNDCNNFASLSSLEGDFDSQLAQFADRVPGGRGAASAGAPTASCGATGTAWPRPSSTTASAWTPTTTTGPAAGSAIAPASSPARASRSASPRRRLADRHLPGRRHSSTTSSTTTRPKACRPSSTRSGAARQRAVATTPATTASSRPTTTTTSRGARRRRHRGRGRARWA